MKLTKQNKVQIHQVSVLLNRELNIDYSLAGKIAELLDEKYYIRSWKNPKHPKNWYWRLTFPLSAIVFVILFFIVCPIKWIITGRYYFTPKSTIYSFYDNWVNKF